MSIQGISALGVALPIALFLLLGFWLLFRKHASARLPALRSMLLLFLLLMTLQFLFLLLHEGGHSLYTILQGVPVTLYVHPFFFSGFSRPIIDTSIWMDILGSVISIPVALWFSLPLWKRRSNAPLPLVMLFPWVAMFEGINIAGIMGGVSGDFMNVVQKTGVPAALFAFLGGVIFCIGLLSFFSLFPLAGLDPHENNALFVVPASMFLVSVLSFLVAQLFVPGSPIDRQYNLAPDILLTAGFSILLYPVVGFILGLLYVTLFRKVSSHLPAWLQNDNRDLAWKDLRIPAILWAVSVVIGLIIII
jgi:hypothetical protein